MSHLRLPSAVVYIAGQGAWSNVGSGSGAAPSPAADSGSGRSFLAPDFTSSAISPAGVLFAGGTAQGTIHVWRRPASHHGVGLSLGASHGGASSGIMPGWAVIGDTPDGGVHAEIAGHAGAVTSLEWCAADAAMRKVADVRRTSGPRGRRQWGGTDSAAYDAATGASPEGSHFLSGSTDGSVSLWACLVPLLAPTPVDAAHGAEPRLLLRPHCVARYGVPGDGFGCGVGPVCSLAAHPLLPSLFASCSSDGAVRVWSTAETAGPIRLMVGHTVGARSVSFHPMGGLLASGGGTGDAAVRVWRLEDGRCLRTLVGGHAGGITALRFSPGGRMLASGDECGGIRLWDLARGVCLPFVCRPVGVTLGGVSSSAGRVFAAVVGIDFSPCGQLVAAAFAGGLVTVASVKAQLTASTGANPRDSESNLVLSLAPPLKGAASRGAATDAKDSYGRIASWDGTHPPVMRSAAVYDPLTIPGESPPDSHHGDRGLSSDAGIVSHRESAADGNGAGRRSRRPDELLRPGAGSGMPVVAGSGADPRLAPGVDADPGFAVAGAWRGAAAVPHDLWRAAAAAADNAERTERAAVNYLRRLQRLDSA